MKHSKGKCLKCKETFTRRDTIGGNGYYFCEPCEVVYIRELNAAVKRDIANFFRK